jgi:predicted kinase
MMAQIHLIVGPVAAGKSTFALTLAERERAVRLNLDAFMAVLFRPDRPEQGVMAWYRERTQRCIEQIWHLTEQLLAVETNVILEIGLILRQDRTQLYRRIDECGYALTIHVLEASRDVRRSRVELRNREQGETFSMVVPPEFFELASDLWEMVDDEECQGRDVRFLFTD